MHDLFNQWNDLLIGRLVLVMVVGGSQNDLPKVRLLRPNKFGTHFMILRHILVRQGPTVV